MTLDAGSPAAGGPLRLENGSRVAVVGGGPAGSFFSYFVLQSAERMGLRIRVDIYEPRDFTRTAPHGCNMCGGIISESLVQNMAAEGLDLGRNVIQRGIESYQLHVDAGSARIRTPLAEKRIGAVHRGAGPRDLKQRRWESFDGHLLGLAVAKGAHVIPERVREVRLQDGRPELGTGEDGRETYDLLAVAVGVNSPALRTFEDLGVGYKAPVTAKAFIREFFVGEETITRTVGDSMHVMLLDIPRLEVAAVIPKGDYISLCLLGDDIDKALLEQFLATPELRRFMPETWTAEARSCECWPKIALRGSPRPWADRIVFVGDCGVTRLYKDGIGAAYRTAKAAATTAVVEGISADAFAKHYGPACKRIESDNAIGRFMFWVTRLIQRRAFARRAVLRMVSAEQGTHGRTPRLSTVLWDLFTGSAPYRDALLRTLHPIFVARLLGNLALSALPLRSGPLAAAGASGGGALGRVYRDGEVIIRQGDVGDGMYVIQQGRARVLVEADGRQVPVAVLEKGELFGEMALFDKETRSATVVADGEARVLTLDRTNFLRRIHEDPSLAWRVAESMSHRIRDLDAEVARLRTAEHAAQGEPAEQAR